MRSIIEKKKKHKGRFCYSYWRKKKRLFLIWYSLEDISVLVNFECQIYPDAVCNLLTSCQKLSQAMCAQKVSQGCLCEKQGGRVDISDVGNSTDSTVDPVPHHPIHLGSNSISCENLHLRNVHSHRKIQQLILCLGRGIFIFFYP